MQFKKVGHLTDWIGLDDATRRFAETIEDKETREAIEKDAGTLADVSIKIRVLSRFDYVPLIERRQSAETATERLEYAREMLTAALGDVKGLDLEWSAQNKTDIVTALIENNLDSVIVLEVMRFQALTAEQQAGFFTREQGQH